MVNRMSTSAHRYQRVVLLYFLLISASFHCLAQNRGVRSQYQGISLQERMAAMGAMKNAYDQMENDFNSLLSYISEILSQNIDAEMRELMTREYKAVSTLQSNFHQYGLANIRPAFNEMRSRIQREVVDYNNRIARAQEERRPPSATNSVSETWSGTGFALNNGYIVTNAHVVDGARSILVYGVNGSKASGFEAMVVATDQVTDLAIIQISDSRFSGFGTIPYAIKSQDADVGESIWVLGYPLTQYLGNEIKLTNGLVSSKSGYQGDWATYQISAPVQPGNSGGPLFDSKGNIVGIVNSGVPGAENVGYAIKTSYLKNLAARYSLSSFLPTSNSISTLALTEQVKRVNNYVFLLICSIKTVSSSTSMSSSSSYTSGSSFGGATSSTSSSTSSYSSGSLSLSPNELTLSIGQNATLSVYNNKNDSPIRWESMDPTVATVSSSGKVTAVGGGRTSIWATSESGTTRCKIIVEGIPRNSSSSSNNRSSSTGSFSLPQTQVSLYVGGSYTMRLPTSSVDITWSSDNTSIATVSSSGTITGVGVGKTTIWAKTKNGSAKCVVFVEQKPY